MIFRGKAFNRREGEATEAKRTERTKGLTLSEQWIDLVIMVDTGDQFR
jgi:hypothetical protein